MLYLSYYPNEKVRAFAHTGFRLRRRPRNVTRGWRGRARTVGRSRQAEGALGTLDLSQCRAVRPVPAKDTAKAFYFEVDAPDRTYLINTDSTENRDEWIQAIQEGLERMQLKREGGELRDVRRRRL